MTITEMLGTPVSDPTDPIRATSDTCPGPAPVKQRQITDPKRPRLWRSAIAVTVTLCAGLALGVYVIPHGARPAPAASVAARAGVPAAVAGFAELFVAAQLSGSVAEEDLATLYPDGDAPLAATGLWVNRAAATGAVAVDENVWQVAVAAEVLEMVDGAYEPAGIQHFTVIVAHTDAQPVALSAPSRTPAPANQQRPPAALRYTGLVPPDQQRTVVEFLTAYLTGTGEVARYLAPTAGIALFPAPPYVSAAVTDLGADPVGRVRARLTATSTNGAVQVLEYTLEMTRESGVWEVLTLAPAA